MNVKRLVAIILIYIGTVIAWMILAGTTSYRSDTSSTKLGRGVDGEYAGGMKRATVEELWGSPHTQPAPTVSTSHIEKRKTTNAKGKTVVESYTVTDLVPLTSTRLAVDLKWVPRQKGLVWFSTYKVTFSGDYSFKNEFKDQRDFKFKIGLPDSNAAYDNVLLFVNNKRVYPGADLANGLVAHATLKPSETALVKISYGSFGMDSWQYGFSQEGSAASVRAFDAKIATNFSDFDFPQDCLSPTLKKQRDGGWDLEWKYGDLISGSNVGVSLPHKLNPGPFASRLSFFAPVSLLFFFAVMLILTAIKDIRLHPVHYLMVAAAFFSFHLLFSYMVDHVVPFYAFLVASAVSMLLTISYLRLVVDWKFAVWQGGIWQFVFLVLFTYAFFFEGYTGLTITIGAIVTLAVLMQMTGRVNWEEKLTMLPPTKPATSRCSAALLPNDKHQTTVRGGADGPALFCRVRFQAIREDTPGKWRAGGGSSHVSRVYPCRGYSPVVAETLYSSSLVCALLALSGCGGGGGGEGGNEGSGATGSTAASSPITTWACTA